MKTLKEVQVGDVVKVVKLNGSGPVKRRIMVGEVFVPSDSF